MSRRATEFEGSGSHPLEPMPGGTKSALGGSVVVSAVSHLALLLRTPAAVEAPEYTEQVEAARREAARREDYFIPVEWISENPPSSLSTGPVPMSAPTALLRTQKGKLPRRLARDRANRGLSGDLPAPGNSDSSEAAESGAHSSQGTGIAKLHVSPSAFLRDLGQRNSKESEPSPLFMPHPAVSVASPPKRTSVTRTGLSAWLANPQEVAQAMLNPPPEIPLASGVELAQTVRISPSGTSPTKARKARFTVEQQAVERVIRKAKSLAASRAFLKKRLLGVWADKTQSALEKRQLIFAMWDECAEFGSRQVLQVASGMRSDIVRFVRRRLPQGSRDEFGRDELKELNKRRSSRAVFAPYAKL